MKVNPFEPEMTAPGADGPARRAGDADARAGTRGPQDGEDEDQRHEETIDEPGYGHGV